MPDFVKMSVTQRVKHLIEVEKIFNQARLAELMGVKPPTVSELLKKEKDLPTKYLTEIAKEYKVLPNWLLTGEGEMLTTHSQPEPENMITDPLIIKEFRNGTGKRHELQAIPLYDVTAAAGLSALHNSSQHILDYMSIPNLAKCDGAIYLKGDSMYPLLKHGDIVAFQVVTDWPDDIYFGEMYIVDLSTAHREKIVCKYVQKSDLGPEYVKLVSYNEKHHPAKDVHIKKIRAMAEVKASIRLT